MLESNSYLKRGNRFDKPKTNMVEEKYSCIQMKKNLKSLHVETEKFTNFVSSQGSKKYKELKEIYNNLCKNTEKTIGNEFIVDEIIYNSSLNKLQKLIFENTKINLSKIDIVNNVQKFDYIKDTGIRLYFIKENNKVLNLVLVDLYHLVIVSQNRNYTLDYNNHKKDRYDIKNIVTTI